MTEHAVQSYTVERVDFAMTPDSQFPDRKITYREYFMERYSIDVLRPQGPRDQPMLVCLRRKGVCVIPPSLAKVTGPPRHSDERALRLLRTNLIQKTRTDPNTRYRQLRDILPILTGQPPRTRARESLQESGIAFIEPTDFMHLVGRQMDVDLCMADVGLRDLVEPGGIGGAMKRSVARGPDQQLLEVLVLHERGERELGGFMNALNEQLMSYQVGVAQRPTTVEVPGDGRASSWVRAARNGIEDMLRRHQMETGKLARRCLVIAILPDSLPREVYSGLKKLTYVDFPVACQCVRRSTLAHKMGVARSKLVGQIVVKCGGWIWAIPAIKESLRDTETGNVRKTMVIGVSTGKMPRQQGVLAACASTNDEMTSYMSAVQVLPTPSGTDTLSVVDTFKEREAAFMQQCLPPFLQRFAQTNGCTPERIVIYRDGVPEAEKPILHK